jgi:hypothetical protein
MSRVSGSVASSPRKSAAAEVARRNEFLEAQARRMGQQMRDLEEQNADLVSRVTQLEMIETQLETMLESDHQIKVCSLSVRLFLASSGGWTLRPRARWPGRGISRSTPRSTPR